MPKTRLAFVVVLAAALSCILSLPAEARWFGRHRQCPPCPPAPCCDDPCLEKIDEPIPPADTPSIPVVDGCAGVGRQCYCCSNGKFYPCTVDCDPGTKMCWKLGDPVPICMDRYKKSCPPNWDYSKLWGMVRDKDKKVLKWAKKDDKDFGYYSKCFHNQPYKD
jgi:hypothetical protein